jgi:glutamate:GABA antiporter
MSTVDQESAQLRQELRLTDLVLTQILYVVGLSWVGTAAKLGTQQIPFWPGAMAMFYVPQAIVVVHLSRSTRCCSSARARWCSHCSG